VKWESNRTSLQNNQLNSSDRSKVLSSLRKKKYYASGQTYIFFFLVLIIWIQILNVFFNSIGANHGDNNSIGIYVVR